MAHERTDGMKTIYETTVVNTGGRSGESAAPDGSFAVKIAGPGTGVQGATNPEQLFAAGYSACFNSALALVMQKARIRAKSTVTATVSLRSDGAEDFGLAVLLEGHIDGLTAAEAQPLLAQAHQVCPYSKATRGNIDVVVRAV